MWTRDSTPLQLTETHYSTSFIDPIPLKPSHSPRWPKHPPPPKLETQCLSNYYQSPLVNQINIKEITIKKIKIKKIKEEEEEEEEERPLPIFCMTMIL